MPIANPLLNLLYCIRTGAYRVNINAGIFVITGIVVVAIAFITVGIQATREAVGNPVKSIRTE